MTPEFSFPIDIAVLPTTGRTFTITASAEERARVAERLGLQKVDALSAKLDVKMTASGQVVVAGTLVAEVTQTCVVTLGPVPAALSEPVSAAFVTEERAAKDRAKLEKAKRRGVDPDEEPVDLNQEDPPEVAKEGRIDLGEVAVVHLALALDPYPRAPGAAFDPKAYGLEPEKDENLPAASPFAALAKLKKPPAKGGEG